MWHNITIFFHFFLFEMMLHVRCLYTANIMHHVIKYTLVLLAVTIRITHADCRSMIIVVFDGDTFRTAERLCCFLLSQRHSCAAFNLFISSTCLTKLDERWYCLIMLCTVLTSLYFHDIQVCRMHIIYRLWWFAVAAMMVSCGAVCYDIASKVLKSTQAASWIV